MLCTLYLGPAPGPWRDAVRAHAAWLGLDITAEVRRLDSGTEVEVAWLHPRPAPTPYAVRDAGPWLVITPFGDPPGDLLAAREREALERAALSRADNVGTIAVHRTGREVVAVVPPASPHQWLWAGASGGLVLADDLRLFRRIVPARLDDRALYALAQFGAIPAPLTLFREVRRVPGGHALRLDPASGASDLVPRYRPAVAEPAGAGTDAGAQARIEVGLQAALGEVGTPGMLYFSGGVDSGLLAAQLARLGRRDVQLVNYSFGSHDRESRLAERMAGHLGFRLQSIPHDPRMVGEVIDRVGRDYTSPFGDISVVPTNLLIRRAAAVVPRGGTALEGTGADGAFGFGVTYPWWRRVYALPRIVRRALGAAYRVAQLWRLDLRPVQVLRFVRKSARMSLAQAVVAQHALEGIALRSMPELHRAVTDAARSSIETLAGTAEPAELVSMVDLAWVCVGRMAPKSFDPLRQAGVVPRYPYLEPQMLAVSASLPWRAKCAGGEPKAPLKALLARDVPPAWVYRSKHGFTPPEQEILSSATVQERLHATVLAPGSPFAALCRADRLRSMVALVGRGPTGSGVYDLLWVLLFTSAWLEQVPSGPGAASGRPLPPAPALEPARR